MWGVCLISVFLIITLAFYKIFGLFDIAFFFGVILFVSLFGVTASINDQRIANKFNESQTTLLTDKFQPVYYRRQYCHLTQLNYPDDRGLRIEKYQFQQMVEYKWSRHTFYRIDCLSSSDTVPFESFWIDEDHLNITVIDGVMPCFKKVKYFVEKDTPLFYRLLLPPSLLRYKPKKVMGNLYLPYKPIILNGVIPEHMEYDLIDAIEKAGSI